VGRPILAAAGFPAGFGRRKPGLAARCDLIADR
jgi:hypothetical protein